MANKSTTEREDSLVTLRAWCPPGTRIYGMTRRTRSNGNAANLSLMFVTNDHRIVPIDFHAAAILRLQRDRKYGGIVLPEYEGRVQSGEAALTVLVARLGTELYSDARALYTYSLR